MKLPNCPRQKELDDRVYLVSDRTTRRSITILEGRNNARPVSHDDPSCPVVSRSLRNKVELLHVKRKEEKKQKENGSSMIRKEEKVQKTL